MTVLGRHFLCCQPLLV